MPLDPQQELRLVDLQGGFFGDVAIERIEGDRVFATFTPAVSFASVAELFREQADAANDQLFSEVDQIQCRIDELELHLSSREGDGRLRLDDVQISNGTHFYCRIPNLGLTQATHVAAQAG